MMQSTITAQNMAVRVSRVVMPIPTLPGTDSTEMNKDIQASVWNLLELNSCKPTKIKSWVNILQRLWMVCRSEQCGSQYDGSDESKNRTYVVDIW